jgi:hypothetical protein
MLLRSPGSNKAVQCSSADVSVCVPLGFRQAFDMCRNASFLWAWRDVFAHKTILHQIVCL